MKLARQAEILKIIHTYDIETQEELARKLVQHGFEVTQATVSRDIREMKLTKVTGENGRLHYTLLQKQDQDTAGRYVRVLKDAVLSIDTAENLLIIKTVSGMAMAAAAVLDEMDWGEIAGTIAGDNTIFCAIRTKDEALWVMDKLRKMLETF
ncbi:MAG: arginine repressor [Eubacteriales bacterium]|nr:arginine repressor [Eubacteriales bacterium]